MCSKLIFILISVCLTYCGFCNSESVDNAIIEAIDESNGQIDEEIAEEEMESGEPTFNMAQIIQEVNSVQTTWTAGENFAPDTPVEYLKKLASGALIDEDDDDEEDNDSFSRFESKCDCEDNELPKEFDSRKKWPKCTSINYIYDQGSCGSCWAVATASAFTDRLCIRSEGKFTTKLSSQALLSCCHRCIPARTRDGCNGGWPTKAWKFFHRHGLVTGGDYNTTEGCQPYLIPPCEHHTKGPLPNCQKMKITSPACKLRCYNNKYGRPWKQDLHKAKSVFTICACGARREIYKRGPIVATFAVYEDFLNYKSGVYQYTVGKKVGYHAVRVIGWGVEKGVDYWLVTNSWNNHWGDKGTFKIARGNNEVWFENGFSAAKAKPPAK